MKIAIVTGASSGMGLEFAKGVDAEEKLDEIWLIARRRDRLEQLAGSLRAKARIVPLDLLDPESFKEYAALLEAEKPLVSTLVNAAGFGRFALFDEVDLDTNLRMIDLNDKATVAMTQLTLPYMKRGSRVLNLDSLSAFQPVPYECIYGATKAFVLSLGASALWPFRRAGSRPSSSTTRSATTAPSTTMTSSGSRSRLSSAPCATTGRARTSPSSAQACAARCSLSRCCRISW